MIRFSRPALLTSLLLFATPLGCQKEDSNLETTAPIANAKTKPTPAPAADVVAKIASVQMHQDCPDPQPPKPVKPGTPAQAPAKPAKSAPHEAPASVSPGDSALAPCVQSTLQVSFSSPAKLTGNVNLREVRILEAATGDVLGTLATRTPSIWRDNAYHPWDETLVPSEELQTSYKLTPPDWAKLEAKTGGSSHGVMFVLEVDLEIDGKPQTLRSSDFARQQLHMLPT